MIVVYVHGNANKVRADLLERQWDRALFGRDVGEASRMAYWAPGPLPDPEIDEMERLPAGGAQGAVVRVYDVSLTGWRLDRRG